MHRKITTKMLKSTNPIMSQSKTIIITGASRGIGLAASKYLISQGHKVVAVARSKGPLEKLAADSPDQVLPLAVDLCSLTAGKEIVKSTLEKWQRIDGVIINHGTLEPIKRIADSTAEEWRASFEINAFSGIALVSRSSKPVLLLLAYSRC